MGLELAAGRVLGGLGALALALASPLHALGGVLFSAHMAQHELLMAVAAPLLVLGRPLIPALWAVPPAARRAAGRWARLPPVHWTWAALTRADVAWVIYAAAIIVWHVPALYQRSVESAAVHSLQHASFLVAALLYWWSIFPAGRASGRGGVAVFSLFTTALYTGGLGALLTFARDPWYLVYAETTLPWRMTPLEEQQLAGVIMWVPAGLSYLAAALAVVLSWLGESENRIVRESGHRRHAATQPLS